MPVACGFLLQVPCKQKFLFKLVVVGWGGIASQGCLLHSSHRSLIGHQASPPVATPERVGGRLTANHSGPTTMFPLTSKQASTPSTTSPQSNGMYVNGWGGCINLGLLPNCEHERSCRHFSSCQLQYGLYQARNRSAGSAGRLYLIPFFLSVFSCIFV